MIEQRLRYRRADRVALVMATKGCIYFSLAYLHNQKSVLSNALEAEKYAVASSLSVALSLPFPSVDGLEIAEPVVRSI